MYKYINKIDSITNTILNINKIDKNDLDVSNFNYDFNQECLKEFKDKINEYKDLKFYIVGDYDVDGIFSTVIITRLLSNLNIDYKFYIPSRSVDGYGINKRIIDNALDYDFNVLFLLDNGVSANEEINYAKEKGLKIIVIDHHEYSIKPNVDALIHPSLLSDDYDDACTGGLSLLLAESFYRDDLNTILGGVASVADMVKVFKYNRFIMKEAIRLLNSGLFNSFNLLNKKNNFTFDDLSFSIIPKINAVSRMDKNPNKLIYYFSYNDKNQNELIKEIEIINNERKDETTKMINIIDENIDLSKRVLVISNDEFKEGLCGLAATRINAITKKPVLILSHKNGMYKGSGRSNDTLGIYEYLYPKKDIFETFGGHLGALGLSIKEENFNKLLDYIENTNYDAIEEEKIALNIDLEDVSINTIEEIEKLKPFGTGFKEPAYCLSNFNITNSILVSNKYPKYVLDNKYEAIYFKGNEIDLNFKGIIAKMQKDNYHKDKVSIIIEEMIYDL